MFYQGSEDEENKSIVPVDLWEVKKLSDSDFWFLKSNEEADQEPEEILDELVSEEGNRTEHVSFISCKRG